MQTSVQRYTSNQLERRLRLIRLATWGFVVSLAAGFVGYGVIDAGHSIADAEQRLTVQTDLLAEHVEAQASAVERQMLGMQALLALQDARTPRADQMIRKVLLEWCRTDPACMDLLVIDDKGTIIHWTGEGSPPAIADREYVRVHLTRSESGTYMGIPQLSRVHQGRWFFAMSLAERDTAGALRRIYVSVRDLSRSFDYARTVGRSEGSSFAVASTKGEIYVREPDRERHMGKMIPDVGRVLAESSTESQATLAVSHLDQIERLIVTRRSTRHPLFVAATQSTASIYGQWRYRAVLVGSLWLLLAAIAFYVGRRLMDDARLQNYLASIDGLTGILNRRALMSEAQLQQERRANGGGLGLMMLDVDHFKRINDCFGHAVGDEVLRRVAATLRLSARGTDVLGRYGGEEFLLLLPGADEGRIAKVGEKLRAAIEAIPALEFADRPGYPQTLTISIGGAVMSNPTETLDHAIARADQALYQAKNAGRNRVMIAPKPE